MTMFGILWTSFKDVFGEEQLCQWSFFGGLRDPIGNAVKDDLQRTCNAGKTPHHECHKRSFPQLCNTWCSVNSYTTLEQEMWSCIRSNWCKTLNFSFKSVWQLYQLEVKQKNFKRSCREGWTLGPKTSTIMASSLSGLTRTRSEECQKYKYKYKYK